MKTKSISVLFLLMMCPPLSGQQADPVARWAALAYDFRVYPNIVYSTAGGYDSKLDVITAADPSVQELKPRPTLIWIHGGGWNGGQKEEAILVGLPFLEKGMNFVNVEYRMGPVAHAPAAVEDCRCALQWVYSQAGKYGFDTKRLVLAGNSAGGHLSLLTGMLTPEAGFDNVCALRNGPSLNVAAIVNFYGGGDLVESLNIRSPNILRWFGRAPNMAELAKQLSPTTYIRKGIPPIITVQGDADPLVAHGRAIRFHEALDRAGVPNQLYTVPGGKHGHFGEEPTVRAFEAIFTFLKEHGVLTE